MKKNGQKYAFQHALKRCTIQSLKNDILNDWDLGEIRLDWINARL